VATDRAKGTGRKRGNNEGSIYQREDGRWTAQLTLDKGKRKYIYGKTRREVQEKLTAAMREVQQGVPLPSGRLTLGQFLARWLEQSAKPRVRPKTYVSYEGTVRLHIVPALGKVPMHQVTPDRVQQLLNEKRAAGLSARSVAYIRTVLRIALTQAEKWAMVSRNVAALADSPRVERHKVRPLSPDQAREFLATVRGDRLEALYTVALALGLRKGEALGLLWEDVELDAGSVTIRHQLQRVSGRKELVATKTQESNRAIALPPAVVDALRTHRIRQLEERLLAGERWRDSGHVFTSSVGTPLDERGVTRKFQRSRERAGLPPMRFHDLRHSAASLLLAQGVPMRMITELLGHTTIGTTADLYTHILPELRRDTADKMQAILTGTS
jgi:integrase